MVKTFITFAVEMPTKLQIVVIEIIKVDLIYDLD